MKKRLIWISYDLGIKGDYSSLYSWLDSRDAKECGNSVAALQFVYKSNLISELKKSLTDEISLNKNSRIYLIRQEKSDGKSSVKGKFLIGKRKPSPWEGFSNNYEDSSEDVDE